MPVMHGVFPSSRKWLVHLQHFFDAVLYADNPPNSMNAVDSHPDSAFRFSHQFASSFIPTPF